MGGFSFRPTEKPLNTNELKVGAGDAATKEGEQQKTEKRQIARLITDKPNVM
jgi:hypothetical protein